MLRNQKASHQLCTSRNATVGVRDTNQMQDMNRINRKPSPHLKRLFIRLLIYLTYINEDMSIAGGSGTQTEDVPTAGESDTQTEDMPTKGGSDAQTEVMPTTGGSDTQTEDRTHRAPSNEMQKIAANEYRTMEKHDLTCYQSCKDYRRTKGQRYDTFKLSSNQRNIGAANTSSE